jgi:hypothetical protein
MKIDKNEILVNLFLIERMFSKDDNNRKHSREMAIYKAGRKDAVKLVIDSIRKMEPPKVKKLPDFMNDNEREYYAAHGELWPECRYCGKRSDELDEIDRCQECQEYEDREEIERDRIAEQKIERKLEDQHFGKK